jgi:hypothetical protein
MRRGREKIKLEGTCYVLLQTNKINPIAYERHDLIWYPERGKTIKALSKTLGIMVFKRRYQAEAFIKVINSALIHPSTILRVEVFSKGKYPKYVSRWTSFQSDLN